MQIRDALTAANLSSTDAEVLLVYLLQTSRTYVLAHPEQDMTIEQEQLWQQLSKRRRNHEPVAYLIGSQEFYGRSFIVNRHTLIPRPATEALVQHAAELINNWHPKQEVEPQGLRTEVSSDTDCSVNAEPCRSFMRRQVQDIDTDIVMVSNIWGTQPSLVVDIGTGSGCIAVSIACELPDVKVMSTDISEEALIVARQNAERHQVADRIEHRGGDCLSPIADLTEPFLIVSNPPYIPKDQLLDRDVQDYEPTGALFAGEDGTHIIKKIVSQAKAHPYCQGITMECRKEQQSYIL